MGDEWRDGPDGPYREVSGDGNAGPRGGYHTFTTYQSFQIREWAEQGMSARQIGERLGRDRRAVERHARRKWGTRFINRYRDDEPDLLRALLQKNWTIPEIAEHWQRTPGAILAFASRNKISVARPKRTSVVRLRIHGELLARIEAVAGVGGRAVSKYVREILRTQLPL
jgi:hypothetical protein